MAYAETHVLERKSQSVRGARRVAPRLKAEMKARGLTAKELSIQIAGWAREDLENRQPIDFRTIQNAMDGTACALETFLTLGGFFGWDWFEDIQTPVIGADPTTAREKQLEQTLAAAAALNARLERDRAVRAAHRSGVGDMAQSPALRGLPTSREHRTFNQPSPRPA